MAQGRHKRDGVARFCGWHGLSVTAPVPCKNGPAIYGSQDDVPVGIFGDKLKVPMKEIFGRVRQLKSSN